MISRAQVSAAGKHAQLNTERERDPFTNRLIRTVLTKVESIRRCKGKWPTRQVALIFSPFVELQIDRRARFALLRTIARCSQTNAIPCNANGLRTRLKCADCQLNPSSLFKKKIESKKNSLILNLEEKILAFCYFFF